MFADGLGKSGVPANHSLVPKRIDYEPVSVAPPESLKHIFRFPTLVDSQSTHVEEKRATHHSSVQADAFHPECSPRQLPRDPGCIRSVPSTLPYNLFTVKHHRRLPWLCRPSAVTTRFNLLGVIEPLCQECRPRLNTSACHSRLHSRLRLPPRESRSCVLSEARPLDAGFD